MTIGLVARRWSCDRRPGRLELVGRKCRSPIAFSRHRSSKLDDGNHTELKTNSFSGGCWQTSPRDFSNIRAGFPPERLLATPPFLIPLAPPYSQHKPVALREFQSMERLELRRDGSPKASGLPRQYRDK